MENPKAVTIKILHSSQMNSESYKKWKTLISDKNFGEVVLDWCQALRNSSPVGLEIYYLEVYSEDNKELCLGILHTLARLDLSPYLGGITKKLLMNLNKWGFHPLLIDIAFLEVPLMNTSGIFITKHGEEYVEGILEALISYIRCNFKQSLLCLKSNEENMYSSIISEMGLLQVSFLATMVLPLSVQSFDDYLSKLSANKRRSIKQNQKIFDDCQGHIEVTKEITPHVVVLEKLYLSTCDYHNELGEIPVPIAINRDFFLELDNLPRENRVLFLAKLDAQIVGFGMCMITTNTLFFIICGLNYSVTKTTRAYFNIYYEMIRFAIQHQIPRISLGSQAYEVKQRLGAIPFASKYYFEIQNPWIQPVIKLLVKNFNSQKGSQISEGKPL